jgi:hypothetical protein
MNKWDLDEKLIYKNAAVKQAIFVRDDIGMNLLKSRVFIVSTHTSKSCLLPVYYIKMMNGVKVIMRGNFYDWKLSVELPYKYERTNLIPEDCISQRMVENKYDKIPSCYLEGFKESWAWDGYNPNNVPQKFTIECPDEYRVYVVLHTLKNAFPNIEYKLEDNKQTKEEIVKFIEKTYNDNGFNETETKIFSNGTVYTRKLANGWEILWKTHCAIEDLYYDNVCTCDETYNACEEPEKAADFILKYPTVYQAFCSEKNMFKKFKVNENRLTD